MTIRQATDDPIDGEPLGRVDAIKWNEQMGDVHQWRAALLIWQELESGKSQRKLASEIHKSQTHVSRCSRLWEMFGFDESLETLPDFNEQYRKLAHHDLAAGEKAKPDTPAAEQPGESTGERRNWKKLYEQAAAELAELRSDQEQKLWETAITAVDEAEALSALREAREVYRSHRVLQALTARVSCFPVFFQRFRPQTAPFACALG